MPNPDFSKGAAFVQGRYLPIGEAAIPITDWGFLRSEMSILARILIRDTSAVCISAGILILLCRRPSIR